jgi:hypothetical protein
MEYQHIREEEVGNAIKKTSNWKAPGPDKIQNFWWKNFTVVHPFVAKQFAKIVQDPTQVPSFFTIGNTYLISKTPTDCKNRPTICLPTIYKIHHVSQKKLYIYIYKDIYDNNIMAEQQKGCTRSSKGCKEQLIVDSIVLQKLKQQQRNLRITYADYQKAYDSIPHSWLIEILSVYKINPAVINFLKTTMQTWKTNLILTSKTQTTCIENIRRGILQGDALSHLWFTMAINPLSMLLNATQYGFKIKGREDTIYTISHLLYMDDLSMPVMKHN